MPLGPLPRWWERRRRGVTESIAARRAAAVARETPPPPPAPATHAGPATHAVVDDPPPLTSRPLVRGGAYAWSIIGILGLLVVAGFVLGALRLLWVPLALALFPAALLAPLNGWLRRQGVPGAAAALLLIFGVIGVVVGAVTVLAPVVAAEIPGLQESVRAGMAEIEAYLQTRPFGIDPQRVAELWERAQEQILQSDVVRTGLLGAAGAAAEVVAIFVLLLVVLFFYLKDGGRIAAWVRDLFPASARPDAEIIGVRAWNTVGAYFRGQIFVAFVDAVGIGVGVALLGVPLALPLGVLVFFASLFPIVGAVLSGIVAVLVALASAGPYTALAVLGVVIAVQQVESNILAPMVLGKATELHPLAVIISLAAGGILLGVLGAFIAVPVAASVTRAIGHLRHRHETASIALPP